MKTFVKTTIVNISMIVVMIVVVIGLMTIMIKENAIEMTSSEDKPTKIFIVSIDVKTQ